MSQKLKFLNTCIKRPDLEFTDIIVFGQILLNVLHGVRLYLEKN